MLPFKLEPTETLVAPHGFIVAGVEARALRGAVFDRPRRFTDLHFAAAFSGEAQDSIQDWAALFGTASTPPETLPYRAQPPKYLYRLAEGLFCEFGSRPTLPDLLLNQVSAYLRRTAGVKGPIALTGEDSAGRLYDFGQALALASLVTSQPPKSAERAS